MNRVDTERTYWDEAAASSPTAQALREEWICDKNISDEPCVDLIADNIGGALARDVVQVVEIGCGVGRLTVPLAAMFKHARFHAYDISAGMIARAQQAPRITYEVNDGRTLPIPEGFEVDAVYSMLTFQHIDDRGVADYIAEAGRVLRVGGVFYFQFIEGDEHEPFSHHYSLEGIANALKTAGFGEPDVQRGLVDSNWTWIKANKRGTK